MTMRVTPLSEVLGAEVRGVDLAGPLTGSAFGYILDVFYRYQVVVFRDQALTPEAQIAFSRRFGPVERHNNEEFLLGGNPEILVLSNDRKDDVPIGVLAAGDFWHSDHAFKKETGLATLLYAVRLPKQGGDTEFANNYRAYETLSDGMKDRLFGLKGIHSRNRLRNPRVEVSRPNVEGYYKRGGGKENDVLHPIVRTHPVTGRKGLFISPRFTIGIADMDDRDAQPLLDRLFEHLIRPENVYRHEWQPCDFLMWDNRCVNHRACGGYTYPDIRLIHRTTVLGDRPV